MTGRQSGVTTQFHAGLAGINWGLKLSGFVGEPPGAGAGAVSGV